MTTITTPPSRAWQEIQKAKFAERDARIPAEWKLKPENFPPEGTKDLRPVVVSCGILTQEELEITDQSHDATWLIAALATGNLTSTQVVTAFCKRAAIGQQLCNNLTEIMFSDALAKAKELDEHFKTTGEVVGPLHGLPMTIKECFHMKGYDSTNGYISRCFNPSKITSPLPELLQKAGAIFISKTNVPQSMLIAESHNNVFGQTKNGGPVSHLTCGGSSGGEGSNIAFGGSPLGIGTDVGGSIRIPAAANGVYGYKPTYGIVPMIGFSLSGWAGTNTGIPPVTGPIARSARDLTLFTNIIRATKPWLMDPSVIPGVYELPTSSRKPVIGLLKVSGITPHPPVLRALDEAAAKLRSAGFEIREFTPPNFLTEVKSLTSPLFTLDALSYAKQELERAGEPPVPSQFKIGFWQLPRKSHEEAWELNAKRHGVAKKMLDTWTETGVDVVISPAGAHTAVLPGDWTSDIYTVAWNAVDYPAAIIPFTHVDPEKDLKDLEFKPLNEADKANEAMYDPELLKGAPVALQIVGPRLGDAQLLRDVELIDQVLNQS